MEEEFYFPPKTHDLEPFFDKFMKEIGSKRIGELVGENPNFPNADYLCDDHQLVIELKVLETDFIKDNDISNLLDKILNESKSKKKAENSTYNEFREYVNRELNISLRNLIRRRLGRVVEKANKQIKSIRKHGIGENFSGILVIINDEFTKIGHTDIFKIVCSVLSQHYRSIDCLIYTTVNLWSDDGTDIVKLLWLTAYGDKATDELSEKIDSIGRQFFQYLEKFDIVQLEHHKEIKSLDELPQMQHIPLD